MLNLVQHLVNMLSHIKSLFLPSAEALFIPVHRTGFSSAAFNKELGRINPAPFSGVFGKGAGQKDTEMADMYGPFDIVTRAQMAAFLARAFLGME